MSKVLIRDGQKARQWRESLNLTQPELAAIIGYSSLSIYWFEQGKTPPGRGKGKDRSIKPEVWQRFKMACAAAHVQIKSGNTFDWGAV